ncbi:MAG: alpha/beta fold hydrolase, partial [Burkholderiales bacterium]
MEPYRRPWWACGRHVQTIVPAISNALISGPRIDWCRERWTTPDGDFVDIDWAGDVHATRLLVLFHGLEGNRETHYARALARHAAANRWCFAFVNFRGCSGESNLKCRAYHAGDSEEIDWILRRFAAEHENVSAAGISLGGNALLKWLGEKGH